MDKLVKKINSLETLEQVGKSKFAKLGMATASLLAISTCMLGIFNDT